MQRDPSLENTVWRGPGNYTEGRQQDDEKPFRPIPVQPIWAAFPFLARKRVEIISGGHLQNLVSDSANVIL